MLDRLRALQRDAQEGVLSTQMRVHFAHQRGVSAFVLFEPLLQVAAHADVEPEQLPFRGLVFPARISPGFRGVGGKVRPNLLRHGPAVERRGTAGLESLDEVDARLRLDRSVDLAKREPQHVESLLRSEASTLARGDLDRPGASRLEAHLDGRRQAFPSESDLEGVGRVGQGRGEECRRPLRQASCDSSGANGHVRMRSEFCWAAPSAEEEPGALVALCATKAPRRTQSLRSSDAGGTQDRFGDAPYLAPVRASEASEHH